MAILELGKLILPTAYDSNFKRYPNLDSRYGPYSTTDEALSSIPSAQRCVGLTVGIKTDDSITEYWFQDGIEDANLVAKANSGGSGDSCYANYVAQGGTKTETQYNTIIKNVVDTDYFIKLSSNVSSATCTITFNNGTTVSVAES